MFFRFLLILTVVSSATHASEVTPWNQIQNLKCQKEFIQLASDKSWDKEYFREHVGGSYKEKVYRNLSNTIGEWLEVHLSAKASPEMVFIKDSTITRFNFDNDCKAVTKNESWPWYLEKVFAKNTSEDWSNENLKQLVSSGKKGMIYTWSPKFAFSVYELPNVERLAKKFGYEFTAVVDPRASKEEIEGALEVMYKKTQKQYQRQLATKFVYLRNTSTDLYMRGEFNHFPVTYVYNNNKIHPRWITGVMKDNGLKSLANTYSNELAGVK